MKYTFKVVILFLFLSLCVIRPTPVLAYWHHHDYVSVRLGWPGYYGYGYPYYAPYYDPYYYPGYAVVASSSYQPVVVNGATYYVNNGVYYTYTQYGYQPVSAPVGVSASAPVATATVSSTANDDTVTINIPNKSGGYTPVVLKKSGNGFVGPQGEFYAEFPRVSQLQTIYGK